MSSLVTKEYKLHSAQQFYEQFSDNVSDNIYLFISKITPWPNDLLPPVIDDTIFNSESPRKTFLSFKKVNSNDVSFVSERINWTTGNVYNRYTINSSLTNFYVVTDEMKVYKVIDNNNNSPSTVKPTSVSQNIFSTNDGYVWKYMFTIRAIDAVKFLTNSYFPVKTLLSDDGTDQWTIQQNAIKGQINTIDVINGGTNYTNNSGTVVSSTTNTVVLGPSASSVNNFYNGMSIYINSGIGNGQLRTITSYDGSTKTATISANWDVTPNNTSNYIVSPRVVIDGDGTGWSGYCVMTNSSISRVIVLNPGINYTEARFSIVSNFGTGAILLPNISPKMGHGSDPVVELYSSNVALSVKLQGDESNTFIYNNDFRQIGLIANPKLYNNTVANGIVYDMTYKINYSNLNGSLVNDEILLGQTSGATFRFVETLTGSNLRVIEKYKTPTNLETFVGQTSGATFTFNSLQNPSLNPETGNILYIKNISPVTRNPDQTEDFKFITRW